MTDRPLEYCTYCNSPTGKVGQGEDSLFFPDKDGPYCEKCYDIWCCPSCNGTGNIVVYRNVEGGLDYLYGERSEELAICDNCKGIGHG